MKRLCLLSVLCLLYAYNALQAQDTLPNFSLKNIGNNRVIVSWTSTYTNIKQISIQRSFDSLTGYKTILTVPDPTTPQNGYVDAKAVNDHMFYRIYIMLEKGIFLFSPAKKPIFDSTHRADFPNGIDKILGNDTVAIPNLNNNNRNKPPGFIPSLYVFTHRDGYVKIKLPDDEKPKKYSIKFFDEGDNFLFEIKEIKEKEFKLDKTNFYHAGWFKFELYEDGKLFEKYKFYLEKDF